MRYQIKVEQIKINTEKEIQMLAIKVDNWNQELSPWKAPAVFGKEAFGEGALNLLTEILKLLFGLKIKNIIWVDIL